VSSDSDFTRLATRLRESGATVYGLGERKTPEPFQAACDRFIFIEVIGVEDPEKVVVPPHDPDLPNLQSLLTRGINRTSQDDGWARLSALGSDLIKLHASFDPRNYGFAKLSSLVSAQSYLEVQQSANGPQSVRIKPAKKPTAKKAPAKKAAKKR
jgi:hypothetical protein